MKKQKTDFNFVVIDSDEKKVKFYHNEKEMFGKIFSKNLRCWWD